MPYKDPEQARRYQRRYQREVRKPQRQREAQRQREQGYLGKHGGSRAVDIESLPYVALRRRGGRWHAILRGRLQAGDVLCEPFAVLEK